MKTNLYDARILADSQTTSGSRLTTFEITFPRFVLAEFNTHRVFSRNSASSRAIPIEAQIAKIVKAPFVPESFGSKKKGMSGGEPLTGMKHWLATQLWLKSRYIALGTVKLLDKLAVHKSWANRLLEPWMWHTVIVTATEWENFFALRTSADAQPELRKIACMMQNLYLETVPKIVKSGDWHLPMVSDEEKEKYDIITCAKVSAGRCARWSYNTQHNYEPVQKSLERSTSLMTSGHWSPFEHQAYAQIDPGTSCGNFHREWIQFRKIFPYEDNFAKLSA